MAKPRQLTWRSGAVRRANEKGIWLQGDEDWVNWSTYVKEPDRPAPPGDGEQIDVGLDKDGFLREWRPAGAAPAPVTVRGITVHPAMAAPPVEVAYEVTGPIQRVPDEDPLIDPDWRDQSDRAAWRTLLASTLRSAATLMTVVPDEQLPLDKTDPQGRKRVKRSVAAYALGRQWAEKAWHEPIPPPPQAPVAAAGGEA